MKPTIFALLIITACTSPSTSPSATPVWQDEFDGPAGASFDRTKWVADTGGHGWGNQERQFYTTRTGNVALDGDGHLVITARAEPTSSYECWYGRCLYTSTRLKTKGLFGQTYGRFEARIRVPCGQGIWPAFWMLGEDIDSVGWPQSGEIDIMEHIGRGPTVAYGTLHGPGYSGAEGISAVTAGGESGDPASPHFAAGGESGDPASPHFNDQAAAYAMGALRDVYFYRLDVEANMERSYHPGQ